jgi:drug/metabolite transporter (DMT)-like permease
LLLVQPLLVSSLLFALPISARFAHKRVTRREWVWALLLTVGLALFVLVAHTRQEHHQTRVVAWALVAGVVVPLVVVCVALAARTTGRRRAVLLAIAVAVLFGLLAVLTKITMHQLAHAGLLGALTVPAPYLFVVLAITATVLQQSAFHAGALQMSVPTMLVVEPLVAVVLGVVVLGEKLAISGPAMVALAIAVAAMAASTIALGRDEGAYEQELEAAATARRPRTISSRL